MATELTRVISTDGGYYEPLNGYGLVKAGENGVHWYLLGYMKWDGVPFQPTAGAALHASNGLFLRLVSK